MQFIRAQADEGARALGALLGAQLAGGKRVTWFFSGGSNIPLTVQIMSALPDTLTRNLTILPIDERYGPLGHADSNSQQLLDAGFQPKLATFIPVLDGSDENTTVQRFVQNLGLHLSEGVAAIAQLGMGSDGHVAGILPHSTAADAQEPVALYDGSDGRRRITVTFPVLRRMSATYLFAYGENKRIQLENLRGKSLPLGDQPAQILKELPDVYVYNDQIA